MAFIIHPPENIEIQFDKRDTPKEIGSKLYDVLEIDEALNAAYEASGQLVLPIVIESDNSKVLELPWELLYYERFGFLATNPQFTLSRKIPNTPEHATSLEKAPLRLLFFSTLPDDLEESKRLAVESEQIAVLEALLPSLKEGTVQLQIPNDGRFESLKHHIEDFKPHLVFLSGHSVYHEGKGYFLFEDKRGLKQHIDEEQLSNAFVDSTVECVVLSSCHSAKGNEQELNSGLARALAFKGISHVVGMSDSIYDKAGATFAEHFVGTLAKQKSVAIALQKGREAVKDLDDVLIASHFFLPLLLSQDIGRALVDWHFEPQPPKREMTLQKLNQLVFPRLFIGRRKEFREFYNRLYDNELKKLLIFGEGGMGKSALVGHFALKLRAEGYKVFDYSLKHGGDFEDFVRSVVRDLSFEDIQKYEYFKAQCTNEQCKVKELIHLIQEKDSKVVFVFDNLESIQNETTKALEDKTLKAWIEVLSQTDDVVLLMTSRWLLPECKEFMHLIKPLKADFLHYIALQNIDFSEKSKIDKVYETLGGNYRGTEFFVKATKNMSLRDEQFFLEKLSDVEEEMQIDMAIEKILSFRTPQELELLQRMTVYPVAVPREGIRSIALDLPQKNLDILVSFSLVEESYNHEQLENEYQVSALVMGFMAKELKVNDEIRLLASEYQLYLFLNERKNLTQALIAHEALLKVDEVKKLDHWLFDEENREDITLRGLVLGELGHQYHAWGEYGKSLKYSEQSLKIRQEIGDKSGEGRTLNNISQIYDAQGDYTTALTYLEQSLKIVKEIGDKSGEGTRLNNIATVYQARGEYEIALTYLEQSLKVSEEIGDPVNISRTSFNMAHIYWGKDNQEKAILLWTKAYKIASKIGWAEALNALANLAPQLGLEHGLESWKELAQKFN